MSTNAGQSPLVLRVVAIGGDEDALVRAYAEYLVACWQERQHRQVAPPSAAPTDDVAA
jgi:hypothetical protein